VQRGRNFHHQAHAALPNKKLMKACALNMFGKLVIITVESVGEASEKEKNGSL
jgi:hypothetical protein